MEGGLQNQFRPLRTMRHVLRTNEFPKHIPNNDGYHLPRTHINRRSHRLHGRNPNRTPRRPLTPPTSNTSGTYEAGRARPLSQTGEVRLRSTRSRIPGINNRIRENTNGPNQSRRSKGMATTKEPHGITRIHGLYQFLPPLHQRILARSQATQRSDEEGHTLGMDPRKATSIRKTESTSL